MANPTARLYFEKRFPWELFDIIVTRNGTVPMGRREIAMRLEDSRNPGKLVMWRKGIFKDWRHFRHQLLLRASKLASIDMGPLWPTAARDNSYKDIFVWQREITLDVDLNDYDEQLRHCPCRGSKSVCQVCWNVFIKPSIAVMKDWLGSIFGFQNLCFFFSGGRGVHCWVFDTAAVLMDDEQRRTLSDMLSTRTPSIVCMEEVIIPTFERYIVPWLIHDGVKEVVLSHCPEELKRSLPRLEQLNPQSWQEALDKMPDHLEDKVLTAVAWACLKPKVDPEPLKAKHLLKMPFSTHQRTGNIVLPLLDDYELRIVHHSNETVSLAPYVQRLYDALK